MLSKPTFSFILSCTISFLLFSSHCMAQATPTTTADTTHTFKGVAISVDLAGAIQLWVSDYGQYEAALRANLKDKYFPIVEIGWGHCNTEDVTTHTNYKVSAPYTRIGCDFNLLKNKHDIYRLYGGARYAFSSYKYNITALGLIDPVWGTTTNIKSNHNQGHYHWLEGVVGIDAKIWGPVHLGWSLRYKRRLLHKEATIGQAYYVPGYGREAGSRIGGSFNLSIEF